jgi:predicted amidohydrolase
MVANGGYYFIAANNWGKEEDIIFSGGSIILSPDLLVLSQSTASTNIILYANIEINRS